MITEEKMREGYDAIKVELKEQVKKLYSLVQNENWEDAANLHVDMGVNFMGVVMAEEFLND